MPLIKQAFYGVYSRFRLLIIICLLSMFFVTSCSTGAKKDVLGKKRIFAFLYLSKDTDPKTLRSANLVHGHPKEWNYWKKKGVVSCQGKTWFDLLNNPIDKAVEILTTLDYGDNPHPVVCIDELGFDFGGQMDQKAAEILRKTKEKMPQLSLVVWQTQRPVAPVLADAFRDVVDLIIPEAYVGGPDGYWYIFSQERAAQLQGLMNKTVVGLGLGIGGYPGENWIETKAELEQQIRFLRFIAPESPGVAFFAAGAERGEPGLVEFVDELCARFDQIPTDGTGLREEIKTRYKPLTQLHDKPLLVVSPRWVELERDRDNPDWQEQPAVLRMLLMNLGNQAADHVEIRLRNPEDKDGKVFAMGSVAVSGKSVAVARLPVIDRLSEWKQWDVDINPIDYDFVVLPEP